VRVVTIRAADPAEPEPREASAARSEVPINPGDS
jgi:hypothetical protein